MSESLQVLFNFVLRKSNFVLQHDTPHRNSSTTLLSNIINIVGLYQSFFNHCPNRSQPKKTLRRSTYQKYFTPNQKPQLKTFANSIYAAFRSVMFVSFGFCDVLFVSRTTSYWNLSFWCQLVNFTHFSWDLILGNKHFCIGTAITFK